MTLLDFFFHFLLFVWFIFLYLFIFYVEWSGFFFKIYFGYFWKGNFTSNTCPCVGYTYTSLLLTETHSLRSSTVAIWMEMAIWAKKNSMNFNYVQAVKTVMMMLGKLSKVNNFTTIDKSLFWNLNKISDLLIIRFIQFW